MKLSKIGWCDYSGGNANFVRGCTPVSEGCANCYARVMAERFGHEFEEVTISHEKYIRLMNRRWPVSSPKRGGPGITGAWPIVFLCDTGDLFHMAVPDEFLLGMLTDLSRRASVTWIILTKRAQRMHDVVTLWCGDVVKRLPPNIWLGVTAENQARADERIPILLDTPAAVRFVSIEPMLGPVDLTKVQMPDGDNLGRNLINCGCDAGLDWVIVGAESGPHRRPFDVAWAAGVKEQCDDAGVPFFGKQDSGLRPGVPLLLDGREYKAWPR